MDYKFRGGGKGSISLHCTYAVIYMTCQRLYKKKKKMVKEEEEERPSLSHFVCVWAFVGLCVCAVVEVAACSKPVKTAGVPSESNTLWKKKISSSFGKKKKKKISYLDSRGNLFSLLPPLVHQHGPASLFKVHCCWSISSYILSGEKSLERPSPYSTTFQRASCINRVNISKENQLLCVLIL